MQIRTVSTHRDGLSLIEVILAVVIFLFSLAAIGQLISFSSDRAIEARWTQEGMIHCQSKMDEFEARVLFLESTAKQEYEIDPSWQWSAEIEQDGDLPTAFKVKVTFERRRANDTWFQVSLQKIVIDPDARGSTLDPAPSLPEEEEELEEEEE
ncbi:MAG: hypothetical protein ACFCD0_08350 [Gemmataceae bacterium]